MTFEVATLCTSGSVIAEVLLLKISIFVRLNFSPSQLLTVALCTCYTSLTEECNSRSKEVLPWTLTDAWASILRAEFNAGVVFGRVRNSKINFKQSGLLVVVYTVLEGSNTPALSNP